MARTDSVGLPEAFHETLEFAVLASRRDPFDPMEMAIRESGLKLLANTEHLHSNWQLVNEYPLSGELLAMSRVWQSPDQVQYIIAAKGAPEAIIDLCHLDASMVQDILIRSMRWLSKACACWGWQKPHLHNRPCLTFSTISCFSFLVSLPGRSDTAYGPGCN